MPVIRFLAQATRPAAVSMVLLSGSATVSAQPAFESWTTENGLPQNSVNDVLQTRDGYLWLATFGGLVRFDGVRFVVFDRSAEGVESQRVMSLHQDRAGTLWAGTEDGLLIRYRNGTFTTYTQADGLPHAAAVRIDEDEEGVLWVTSSAGITRYDGTRFVTLAPEYFGVRAAPADRYMDVWWREDSNGLHALVNGSVRTLRIQEMLAQIDITGVTTDRHGNLWINTRGAGVIKASGERLERLTTREGLPTDSPEGTFYEGSEYDIWYADSHGLYRIRNSTHERMPMAGMPLSIVRSFYVDDEGSTWFGTTASGLYRLHERPVTVYDARDGVSLRIAYSILQDRAGAIWVGAGGLRRYANGRLTAHSTAIGTSPDRITCMYEDKNGVLWIGTHGGLNYVRNGQQVRYADPSGYLSGPIWAMAQDDAGTYWYASDNGLVSSTAGRFRRYTTADGLSHNRVSALLKGHGGVLWVGTLQGLTRFKNGVFHAYTARDGFIGNQVRALHEDLDGFVWIGTYDGGLYRLANDRLTRYTRADGLYDNGVFQILEDDAGFLWMGSNRGIQRLSRRELNEFAEGHRRFVVPVVFGAKDGLASVEVNGGRQPAGLKTADGKLWFPTMGGVAVIDPAGYRKNARPPRAMIEEVRVADKPIDIAQQVRLPPDSPAIAIRYSAPTFVRPERMRFRHRLAGLHDEWIEAGGRREASFYGLPPGRYRFEVAAAGDDGVWSTDRASFSLVVLPPFWRTAWFVALTAATVVLLALAAHQLRVRHFRNLQTMRERFSQRLIESQERERERISSDMHDSLGQSLRIIRKLARTDQQAAPERRKTAEALEEIAVLTERVQAEMTEIAYGLRPRQLDSIGLSKTIESMVRRVERTCDVRFITDIAVIDDLVPPSAHIHIFRIVQEAVSNVVQHSDATDATIVITRDGRQVQIKIVDNGRGFGLNHTPTPNAMNGGFGLMNIRERGRILGGRVEIHSGTGLGTTVSVALVVEREADV